MAQVIGNKQLRLICPQKCTCNHVWGGEGRGNQMEGPAWVIRKQMCYDLCGDGVLRKIFDDEKWNVLPVSFWEALKLEVSWRGKQKRGINDSLQHTSATLAVEEGELTRYEIHRLPNEVTVMATLGCQLDYI